jgi:hypothetical protein
MGVRDLLEAMRTEALSRLKEERRRRKESLKVRMFLPTLKDKGKGVERRRKVV